MAAKFKVQYFETRGESLYWTCGRGYRLFIFWQPVSSFPVTGKNQEVIIWDVGIHFLRTGKSFSRSWEAIFRELGSHFLGTVKSFSGNLIVIFWEPWSHFPGTAKSFSGNREVIFRESGSLFPGTGITIWYEVYELNYVCCIHHSFAPFSSFLLFFDDCGRRRRSWKATYWPAWLSPQVKTFNLFSHFSQLM